MYRYLIVTGLIASTLVGVVVFRTSARDDEQTHYEMHASFAAYTSDDFITRSSGIVSGKVKKLSVEVRNSALRQGEKDVVTVAEIEIGEWLKHDSDSAAKDTVFVETFGGSRDGITMGSEDSASFKEGEDVLVFLGERLNDRTYTVAGWKLGKYSLDGNSNMSIVRNEYFVSVFGESIRTTEDVRSLVRSSSLR